MTGCILPSKSADEVIAAERAAIVEGIRHYFAPVDDPLHEDVRILCDRIVRGEYGSHPDGR